MGAKKIIFWSFLGMLVVFGESFFLSRVLTLTWLFVVSWLEKEPWWSIFIVGIFRDCLIFANLGESVFFLLLWSLVVHWLKRIFGLGKVSKKIELRGI